MHTIIRGGTDGARLSERGLPTPNIFTGGQVYHSLTEWASVQDMAAAAATAVELLRVWAERAAVEPARARQSVRPRSGRLQGALRDSVSAERIPRSCAYRSVCTPQPSHSWPKRRISPTIGSSA